MEDCVFCKIVSGQLPSEKIMEDEEHVAFLSATPVYDGFTVVATKNHYGSYIYQTMTDEQLAKIHIFAKKVALAIDKALGSERCMQVMEGMDVDHSHVKLFPKYKGVFRPIVEKETFDTSRLKEVAEKIRKVV